MSEPKGSRCQAPFEDHSRHVMAFGALVQIATGKVLHLCQDCAIRVMDSNPDAYEWRPGQ